MARARASWKRPQETTSYPIIARRLAAEGNFILRNLAVQCGLFATRDRGRNQLLDNHGLPTAPGFADDSPLYDRFGFRPIPFDQIGLYDDEPRATWPVEHEITPHYFAE